MIPARDIDDDGGGGGNDGNTDRCRKRYKRKEMVRKINNQTNSEKVTWASAPAADMSMANPCAFDCDMACRDCNSCSPRNYNKMRLLLQQCETNTIKKQNKTRH